MKRLLIAISVLSALFLALCAGGYIFLETPYFLMFGWVHFLKDTLPQVTFDKAAIGLAVVALAALFAGVHVAGRKWIQATDAKDSQPDTVRVWHLRWTTNLVLALLLLFSAGISVVAVTHQFLWLGLSSEPIVHSTFRNVVARTQSRNNMKWLGVGIHDFTEEVGSLPEISVDSLGKIKHGWVTPMLPYLNGQSIYDRIDLSQSWKSPSNRPAYETILPLLQHPNFSQTQAESSSGHALSHYSANQHLLKIGEAMSFRDITDGVSNTLMVGELAQNFRAWGDPLNVRDPMIGFNQPDKGFGSPYAQDGRPSYVQFLLADGSVRAVYANIDPEVLKAISTPDGGEPEAEF